MVNDIDLVELLFISCTYQFNTINYSLNYSLKTLVAISYCIFFNVCLSMTHYYSDFEFKPFFMPHLR